MHLCEQPSLIYNQGFWGWSQSGGTTVLICGICLYSTQVRELYPNKTVQVMVSGYLLTTLVFLSVSVLLSVYSLLSVCLSVKEHLLKTSTLIQKRLHKMLRIEDK